MDIQQIRLDRLAPNAWNPNHIKPELFKKLKHNIQKGGNVLPLVARRHPGKKGYFEIIDGYHRFRIFQELGWQEADVVVVEADDDQAKIFSVNLNYLRGQPKPLEYARLVHDLSEKLTIDDLALVLPDTKPQLLDRLELLKLPGDMQDTIRAKAEEAEKESLETIKFQVTAHEREAIEAALKDTDLKRKGAALANLVKAASSVKESSLKT